MRQRAVVCGISRPCWPRHDRLLPCGFPPLCRPVAPHGLSLAKHPALFWLACRRLEAETCLSKQTCCASQNVVELPTVWDFWAAVGYKFQPRTTDIENHENHITLQSQTCKTQRGLGGTGRDLGGTGRDLGGTWRDLGGTWRDLGGTRRDMGGTRRDTEMSLRCPSIVPPVSLRCPSGVPPVSLRCPSGVPPVSLRCPSLSLRCPSGVPPVSLRAPPQR